MKVLVTGAAGFVGSKLCDVLLARGDEVIGIDCFIDYYPRSIKESNLRGAKDHDSFTFIEGDLLELDLLEILDGVEEVYHQAAQAGVRASWGTDFSIYTNANILATQRLLECCREQPVKDALKKLVYASSSSVYGQAETLPTLESTLPKPLSPYGVSKLAAEHLCNLYAAEFGVPTVSLRYFTVYGPRQRPDMAFNRFSKAALSGEGITIYGDGSQSRDFTFIDDIVTANLLAAEKGQPGDVFNIGGGERISINGVLDLLRDIVGGELDVKYVNRQSGDVKDTGADTSFAQDRLGFAPKVKVKEGLAREVAWMEELLK